MNTRTWMNVPNFFSLPKNRYKYFWFINTKMWHFVSKLEGLNLCQVLSVLSKHFLPDRQMIISLLERHLQQNCIK